MLSLFDAYIMVDWSASSKPVRGANSIWIATCTRTGAGQVHVTTQNPATRLEAREVILDEARAVIAAGGRVLIGFDFAIGYPAGTAAALGLDFSETAPWSAMHAYLSAHTKEHTDNSNTRFDLASTMNAKMTGTRHPFWGAIKTKQSDTLSMKKGDFAQIGSLPEHRISEAWIRGNFAARPKSVWQLTGVGSVGSQALLGIPTVSYLKRTVAGTKLWPFETGLQSLTQASLKSTPCVLAEIYPSTVPVTPKTGETLDELQVKTLSERFESLDRAGKLAAAFDRPDSISEREIHKITSEEGWILAK